MCPGPATPKIGDAATAQTHKQLQQLNLPEFAGGEKAIPRQAKSTYSHKETDSGIVIPSSLAVLNGW